jgi:hypothetical protein
MYNERLQGGGHRRNINDTEGKGGRIRTTNILSRCFKILESFLGDIKFRGRIRYHEATISVIEEVAIGSLKSRREPGDPLMFEKRVISTTDISDLLATDLAKVVYIFREPSIGFKDETLELDLLISTLISVLALLLHFSSF